MPSKPLLTIYKASAGSGKTFTLAAEYISLLLLKPDDFRHILGVTFTNKATGEMKKRILSQLYGIANGLDESDGYLKKAKELLTNAGYTEDCNHHKLTDGQLRTNAGKALDYILHNFSFFRIETIDSFMVGILRNLAKELELGNDMTIELDQKQVIADGVHDLIKGLDKLSPELAWIVDYIDSSISEEHHWDITSDLAKFAENIHKEGWQRHASTICELLRQDKDLFTRLRKNMNARMESAAEHTRVVSAPFLELAQRHGLSADDFNGKSRGPYTFFEKVHDGQTPKVSDTLEQLASGSKEWAQSKSPNRAIIEQYAPDFCQILTQTIAAVREQIRISNTASLATRNLYQLQLLDSIDKKMHENCIRDNRFLLADTCILLKQMASDPNETSFIYEKTGTEINHILIDEFQDTSGVQWANFLPLLIENTSRGHHDLIVGDVKQAIYRWRDSDASIMGHQVEASLSSITPQTETLKTNYRSQANIIRFNNTFFHSLVSKLAEGTSEIDPTDIVQFYSDVEQRFDTKNEGGCVRIITVEKPSAPHNDEPKDSTADEICRHAVEQIVELLDKGIRQSDIAILTRGKKEIAMLADWITLHPEATCGLALRIISNEAFTLGSSDVIALLIEALRWVSASTDIVSLASLGIHYHQLVMNDGLSVPDIMLLRDQGYGLPTALIDRHDALTAMPLCELVHTLYDSLSLSTLSGRDAWLQSFFDVVQHYAAEVGGSLADFLQAWDERLSAQAIPAGDVDGIQAMTIHKSKGLEFHTVILPFCDWVFEKSNKPSTIWVSTPPEQFEGMPCLPIRRCNDMRESDFVNEYKEETKLLWIDNLNLLYVAFTRPTSNLIVIRQANASQDVPKNVSAFIDMGLAGSERYDEELSVASKAETVSANKLLAQATPLPVQFHSAPIGLEFRQSNTSRTFINRGDDTPLSEFIEEGNLLHEVFSRIATVADVPAAVNELYTEAIVDAARRDALQQFVLEALQQPQAADWFSGRYELFNECTVLTDEDGKVTQHRPDRVMRTATSTLVVDFKFGKQQAKHFAQVQRYMNILSQMGFPGVEGYLWYVKEAHIIKLQP